MNPIIAILILSAALLVILSTSGIFKMPVALTNTGKQTFIHAHCDTLPGNYHGKTVGQDSLVGTKWRAAAGR